ncbi:MAG: Fic family protein [Pseudomonadota bacterium]
MPSIGYAHLIEHYALPALPLPITSVLNDGIPVRRSYERGGKQYEEFPSSYRPDNTAFDHLRFALRYEGLNLHVLKLLFERLGGDEIRAALLEQPASAVARRLGFLFEWLTGQRLDIPEGLSGRRNYVTALDEKLQFGLNSSKPLRHEKFRVIDNLPGTPAFCPLVRRTPYLQAMTSKGLAELAARKLAGYDKQLLLRAANFLYLKETHSSFEVEREKPSASRARRFADLLQESESGHDLSMERFVELQNAVVESRFQEASWRQTQNWLGEDHGYRKKVDFVPPRPEDLYALMAGLITMSARLRDAHLTMKGAPAETSAQAIDPVVAATSISFGFVFIHPFLDGNGRLHRYLIHEQLSTSGFTPKGFILPVSAVILASLDRYKAALTAFSGPVMQRTSYDPALPGDIATGNDQAYFQYFDATEQASFLYDALERTIETDLDQEISFLVGFDRAREALNRIGDWPGQSRDLFINLIRENQGHLSQTKRKSQFAHLTDTEIARFENIVSRAFDPNIATGDILLE